MNFNIGQKVLLKSLNKNDTQWTNSGDDALVYVGKFVTVSGVASSILNPWKWVYVEEFTGGTSDNQFDTELYVVEELMKKYGVK